MKRLATLAMVLAGCVSRVDATSRATMLPRDVLAGETAADERARRRGRQPTCVEAALDQERACTTDACRTEAASAAAGCP